MRENNGNGKVSTAAWNATLEDIHARFDKIEAKLGEGNSKGVSQTAWDKTLEDINDKFKKMENSSNKGSVSQIAWDKTLSDIEDRFKKLEGKNGNSNSGVSATAWNAVLNDFGCRFDVIEKGLVELNSKIEKKVGVGAWENVNKELTDKINAKVSVKAWETSLEDTNKQVSELAIKELKELDDRLDKATELINTLTNHLNEKVNMDSWNRLSSTNETLMGKVDVIKDKSEDLTKRLLIVESIIKDAQVSENELKKLLETI
ncbi:MAG TPA: hypothetical protein VI790_03410 [Candidatus Nanoarchaeia archaeon]|nr:hypothetical protein [Candidatus Nanoarchaeia archaeon]